MASMFGRTKNANLCNHTQQAALAYVSNLEMLAYMRCPLAELD